MQQCCVSQAQSVAAENLGLHIIDQQAVVIDEILDRLIELENLFHNDVSKAAVRPVDTAVK